jgi:hypothetical protein
VSTCPTPFHQPNNNNNYFPNFFCIPPFFVSILDALLKCLFNTSTVRFKLNRNFFKSTSRWRKTIWLAKMKSQKLRSRGRIWINAKSARMHTYIPTHSLRPFSENFAFGRSTNTKYYRQALLAFFCTNESKLQNVSPIFLLRNLQNHSIGPWNFCSRAFQSKNVYSGRTLNREFTFLG